MKYQAGEKVRIKTWGEMKNEYAEEENVKFGKYINLGSSLVFPEDMEVFIKQLDTNRVVTIKQTCLRSHLVPINHYFILELDKNGHAYKLRDEMIKGKVIDMSDMIHSRFEILDI